MSKKEENGGSVPVPDPVYHAELMDDASGETRSVVETEPPSPPSRLSYRLGKIVGTLITFAEGVAAITGVINRDMINTPGSNRVDGDTNDSNGPCPRRGRGKGDGQGQGRGQGRGKGRGKKITRTMLKRKRMK